MVEIRLFSCGQSTSYSLLVVLMPLLSPLPASPPPPQKKKQEEEEEFREFREKKDFCPTFAVFLKSQRHLYIKRCLVPGAHCRLWMPETKNRDQTLAALESSILDTKSRHNNSN